MTSDDRLVVLCLVSLAVWILVSSLDDLFIALAAIFPGGSRCHWPTDAEAARIPERRIAILLPLWKEQRVIGRMLERNLAAIQYTNYDFFAGVYLNDAPTVTAVAEAACRSPRAACAGSTRASPPARPRAAAAARKSADRKSVV